MLTLRAAGAIVGLLLATACQSPAPPRSATAVPTPLTRSASPTNTPATVPTTVEESGALCLSVSTSIGTHLRR